MRIIDRQRRIRIDRLVEARNSQQLDRRAFLRHLVATGLSLGAANSLLAACDGGKPLTAPYSLDVLNIWSGEERDSFNAVVEPFTKKTGIAINLETTRNLDAALTIRLRGQNPPDVAVIPNPPKLRQMAEQQQLVRLDTFLDMQKMRQDYSSDWLNLASYQGNLYALVYKASNKGTIWYSPLQFQAQGYRPPTTWDELLALSERIAASGKYPWSMGVESATASGWPAADWIAEIYLKLFGPELYDRWVNHQLPWTHSSVRSAFQLFGRIIGGKHYIAGAPQSILSTGFDLACYEPFSTPPQAYMNYLGDFATGFITTRFPLARSGVDFGFFPFPTLAPEYAEVVTGGADLVVAMRDTEMVRKFMTYLSTAEAQTIWIKRGGATSVNKEVDLADYPNDVARISAHMLVTAKTFRFGAGDLMLPSVQKAFWQGMLAFIADKQQLDTILTTIEQAAQQAYNLA